MVVIQALNLASAKSFLYNQANALADRFGYEIKPNGMRTDFEPDSGAMINRVRPYTMTTPDRIYSLIQAVRYLERAGIEGGIVECGVWRGGSMMTVALTLMGERSAQRDLYLFDTYEGMSEPEDGVDVDVGGRPASDQLAASKRTESSWIWAYAPLEEVARNMASTGYPQERVHLVKGMVEDTLPAEAPEKIALLRLDTDWYASTRHSLEHLYPRLVSGGVLILDDYGHWQGARRAFDEYAAENKLNILLNRVDTSGRIAVKP